MPLSLQPLGTDRLGRQYIVFSADPLSVYVQPAGTGGALANEEQEGRNGQALTALVQPGGEESVWKVCWFGEYPRYYGIGKRMRTTISKRQFWEPRGSCSRILMVWVKLSNLSSRMGFYGQQVLVRNVL